MEAPRHRRERDRSTASSAATPTHHCFGSPSARDLSERASGAFSAARARPATAIGQPSYQTAGGGVAEIYSLQRVVPADKEALALQPTIPQPLYTNYIGLGISLCTDTPSVGIEFGISLCTDTLSFGIELYRLLVSFPVSSVGRVIPTDITIPTDCWRCTDRHRNNDRLLVTGLYRLTVLCTN